MEYKLKMQTNVAIVVVTCDRYSDLWSPFHYLFLKHWPDCPFKTYILTNDLKPELPPFLPLALGPDRSWSDNLIKALDNIPEDYVIIFLEDLLLDGPVDANRLGAILDWVLEHRPDHVRLNCTERPTGPATDLLGHIAPGAIYRTSTVLSLWRKATLRALLKPGENAWQFELIGSQRSDVFEHFYSSYTDCFPLLNSVIKGKWQPEVAKHFQEQGVPLDLTSRPVMTPLEAERFRWTVLRHHLFRLVPWRYRRRLRAWLTA